MPCVTHGRRPSHETPDRGGARPRCEDATATDCLNRTGCSGRRPVVTCRWKSGPGSSQEWIIGRAETIDRASGGALWLRPHWSARAWRDGLPFPGWLDTECQSLRREGRLTDTIRSECLDHHDWAGCYGLTLGTGVMILVRRCS